MVFKYGADSDCLCTLTMAATTIPKLCWLKFVLHMKIKANYQFVFSFFYSFETGNQHIGGSGQLQVGLE